MIALILLAGGLLLSGPAPAPAASGQTGANPSRLPSLSQLTAAPPHMPAVEAALVHCLARAGDGPRSARPSGFARNEAQPERWLYPATRGAALRVGLTEDAGGCSLVVHEWPGATAPISAWLRARGYAPGPRPDVFQRTLSRGRGVQVGVMRGGGRSLLIFVGAGTPDR